MNRSGTIINSVIGMFEEKLEEKKENEEIKISFSEIEKNLNDSFNRYKKIHKRTPRKMKKVRIREIKKSIEKVDVISAYITPNCRLANRIEAEEKTLKISFTDNYFKILQYSKGLY